MKLKYKLGTKIIHIDEYGEEVFGHVVMFMDGDYYCSMYPGAMSNYYWIHCVDLASGVIDEEGDILTLQALNKFKEDELNFADIKTERKMKLEELNNEY